MHELAADPLPRLLGRLGYIENKSKNEHAVSYVMVSCFPLIHLLHLLHLLHPLQSQALEMPYTCV